MSDDSRDRRPHEDRIRERIREQREESATSQPFDRKFDGVETDPTFEQKIGEPVPLENNFEDYKVTFADDVAQKLGDADPTASSLKWENLKGTDAEPDSYMKLGDIQGESADSVVDHKASDIGERPTVGYETVTLSATEETADTGADEFLQIDEIPGESAVDQQSDDLTERPTLAAETVHLTLQDGPAAESILTQNENITSIVAESNATPVAEADDVDADEPSAGAIAFSDVRWEFQDGDGSDRATPLTDEIDDITGGDITESKAVDASSPLLGVDKSSTKLQEHLVDDADNMKIELGLDKSSPKMESGVVADDEAAFKVEINGAAAEVVDPVGDALAPLDGGDELISMPDEDAVDAAPPMFDDDSLDGA